MGEGSTDIEVPNNSGLFYVPSSIAIVKLLLRRTLIRSVIQLIKVGKVLLFSKSEFGNEQINNDISSHALFFLRTSKN